MNTNWLMLAILVLGLVLAWVAGRYGATSYLESEQGAAALVTSVAPLLSSNTGFVTDVGTAPAMSDALGAQLDEKIRSGSVANELIASGALDEYVGYVLNNSTDAGIDPDLLREAVAAELARAKPAVSGTTAAKAASSPELARIQKAMRTYEGKLTALANEVADDESAAAVNTMQGELIELQGMINGLSAEVRCVVANAGGPRNFLLKERRTTRLTGYDLVITLGRLRKDLLSTVSITGPDGTSQQVNTAVKANVRIGRPFEFAANGQNYQGLFTYSQGRWGPDFVGFEVTVAGADGNC